MKKSILVLTGLAAALFFAECALRIIYPGMDPVMGYIGRHSDVIRVSAEYAGSYRFSEELGYEVIPGYSKDINSLGMFDGEYLPEKGSSTVRLLVLGDSVTMSYPDVYPEYERYTEYAEAILNKNDELRGAGIEILNAGFTGYGIMEYRAYLRAKSEKISPDIVLLGITPGDFEKRPFRFISLDGGDVFVYRRPLNGIDILQLPLYRSSVLLRMSTFVFLKRAYLRGQIHDTGSSEDLLDIVEYCRQQNIIILAIVFPLLKREAEYTDADKNAYFMMSEAIKKSGIKHINAGEYMDWGELEKMKKGPDDYIHFSRYGHRILGGIAAEFLREEVVSSYERSARKIQ